MSRTEYATLKVTFDLEGTQNTQDKDTEHCVPLRQASRR